MTHRSFLALVFVALLGVPGLSAQSSPLQWKAVLVAAANNDGLENWDNARVAVHDQLLLRGVRPENVMSLSAHSQFVGTTYRGSTVQKAYTYNVKFALEDLNLGTGDALLIYFTSHGAQNGGISFSLTDNFLSVAQLRTLLDSVPAEVPTVVLISACYSGQFIQGRVAETIQAPNRIVLTAARNDRTSFGCGAGQVMPEWDDSFVVALGQRTPRQTFQNLFAVVQQSITNKESAWGEALYSYPQAWFGAEVRNLTLP
jgi:hypothetical protein